jgi:hypothetical protein
LCYIHDQMLDGPYLKGIAKVGREPSYRAISKTGFEFKQQFTKEDAKELIFEEILHYHLCRRGKSPAGWRNAPALDPKMRRDLIVLTVYRKVEEHTRTRGFRVVRPPERNTLLHCVLY